MGGRGLLSIPDYSAEISLKSTENTTGLFSILGNTAYHILCFVMVLAYCSVEMVRITKKCICMLHCVRKPCLHAAPHRIQTHLSSRNTQGLREGGSGSTAYLGLRGPGKVQVSALSFGIAP